jgi:two-component system sensor histidine kinase CssS
LPIRSFFRKLTLTQQIFSMIVLMLVFLSVFFTFFLSRNIDQTISKQMYSMLQGRQEPLISALESGRDPAYVEDLFTYLSADSIQTSALIQNDRIEFFSETDAKADAALSSFLVSQAQTLQENPAADSRSGMVTKNGVLYYYLLQEVWTDSGVYTVASFMNDSYAQQFRDSLVNSTIYITVIVFFLILMVLMVWVFSIIHPLNQIRNYIDQIKQGKDVELNLHREDEIGELARELTAMKDELTKQEKAKEEMIHNISHDLKTPIATIKSYSESIKDGIYPYGTLDSSVDVILTNAQRLEDKVHNLLYLNRVEYLVSSDASGVVTNMKEVVEQVLLNSAVLRPEIEIIADVDEVFFDGLIEAWRVTIENIMENAFRYAKSYIRIEVKENDLRISNDGPGLPEDVQDALFKPYVKGKDGRFGLGLSIVHKVAKANNYFVSGYNTADGVCFRIYRNEQKHRKRKGGRA